MSLLYREYNRGESRQPFVASMHINLCIVGWEIGHNLQILLMISQEAVDLFTYRLTFFCESLLICRSGVIVLNAELKSTKRIPAYMALLSIYGGTKCSPVFRASSTDLLTLHAYWKGSRWGAVIGVIISSLMVIQICCIMCFTRFLFLGEWLIRGVQRVSFIVGHRIETFLDRWTVFVGNIMHQFGLVISFSKIILLSWAESWPACSITCPHFNRLPPSTGFSILWWTMTLHYCTSTVLVGIVEYLPVYWA